MIARYSDYFKSYAFSGLFNLQRDIVLRNRTLRMHPTMRDTKSIFIHIPKTGGYAAAISLYDRDPWHHTYAHYMDLLSRENEKREDYFVFTIVRDPVERLNSMFHWLKQIKIAHPTMVPYRHIDTFSDFADLYLAESSNPNRRRDHPFLYSQIDYLGGPDHVSDIDFIAKTETLSADYPKISARIFGHEGQLKSANKTKHKIALTDAERAYVADRLKEERELLGYA